MDSPKITYRYYSNPAFCAQSEVVYTQQTPCVSPRISTSRSPPGRAPLPEVRRIPPLGANSPRKTPLISESVDRIGNQRVKTDISDNPLRFTNTKYDRLLRSANRNIPELPPKPGPKPYKFTTPDRREGRKTITRSASHRIAEAVVSQDYVHRRINSSNSDHRVEEELEMSRVSADVRFGVSDEENEEFLRTKNPRILKHRYAEIPDDFDEYSPTKKRIVETEPEEYNVDAPSEDELKEIPTEIVRNVNGKIHRYAIIPSDDDEEIVNHPIIVQKPNSPPTFHITSPGMSRKNLEATQKLHELLATPKKSTKNIVPGSPLKSCASSPSIRSQFNTPSRPMDYGQGFPITPSKRVVSSTPKQNMTPSKSCNNLASPPLPRRNANLSSPLSPKAQQKLNYEIPNTNGSVRKQQCSDIFVREPSFTKSRDESSFSKSREHSFTKSKNHDRSYDMNRSRDFEKGNKYSNSARSTAIISPRIASRGSESIYSSGTVFSGKSWSYTPGCATLALAAAMMALCGALTTGLAFYIMCAFGQKYYLDVGVLSGFTCLILGMLGFRSRTHQMLPNRNYISGYILLSVFSLLSCAALLTLLIGGDKNGALTELIGGAITTLGALCLVLACTGAFASCCCTTTPPDNRVTQI